MAKKNLQSKRGVGLGMPGSNEELVGLLVRSGKLPLGMAGIGTGAQSTVLSSASARSGTPASRSATGGKSSALAQNGGDGGEGSGRPRRATGESWRARSQSRSKANETSIDETSSDRTRSKTHPGEVSERQGPASSTAQTGSTRRDLETDVAAVGPALIKAVDSKALLALAEEADGTDSWNVVGRGMENLGAFDNESRMPSPYSHPSVQYHSDQNQSHGQSQAMISQHNNIPNHSLMNQPNGMNNINNWQPQDYNSMFGSPPEGPPGRLVGRMEESAYQGYPPTMGHGLNRLSSDLGIGSLSLGDQNPPVRVDIRDILGTISR